MVFLDGLLPGAGQPPAEEVVAEQDEANEGDDKTRDRDEGMTFQNVPVVVDDDRDGDPEKRQEQMHERGRVPAEQRRVRGPRRNPALLRAEAVNVVERFGADRGLARSGGRHELNRLHGAGEVPDVARLREVLNRSINETLPRSVLTHATVLAATLALLIFAGEVIRPFSWIMAFGVFTGTFSSIYIAGPILLYIEHRWPRATGTETKGAARALAEERRRESKPTPVGTR